MYYHQGRKSATLSVYSAKTIGEASSTIVKRFGFYHKFSPPLTRTLRPLGKLYVLYYIEGSYEFKYYVSHKVYCFVKVTEDGYSRG